MRQGFRGTHVGRRLLCTLDLNVLVLVLFTFCCGHLVEKLDFVRSGQVDPAGCYHYVYVQGQREGLRAGWEQVGVGCGCEAGAGYY